MKQGKIDPVLLSLDIIGFVLIIIGGLLIRYAQQESFSILGGLVMAVGVAILSITRWVRA